MRAAIPVLNAVVSLICLLALAALAVRGLLDPQGGAQAFGLPAGDASAAFYHAVYRDRNLTIAVIGLAFLLLRMWPALAILASASITLPLYDMLALSRAGMAILPVHPMTLAALILAAALLWLRVAMDRHAPYRITPNASS